MSTGPTGVLSAFVAGAPLAAFDEEIRALARQHVLDTVAAIVACRDLEPAVVARRFALAHSAGAADGVAIPGTNERVALVDAAFAGAMAGHGAEINDFMPSVFVQPGPAVLSTALVLAAARQRSGDDLVRAVIAGYELAARVPRALGTRNLRRAGLANHGVGPVFGAAAAGAALARLTADQVAAVLTACVQQASGSWQWLLDVEHIEKSFVFAGMGARNGLQAVLLAEAGFRGVRRSLDADTGWWASPAFSGGDADPAALTDGLDAPSALHLAALKRYPVGGPAQPAVEGLLGLVAEVDRRDVARVVIEMPGAAPTFRDAAMPALNLRYLAALILLDGHLDFLAAQSLDRFRGDHAVRARMADVEVIHDPAQEAPPGAPRPESARVTVVSASGARTERFVPFVRGYPSHPMAGEEVEAKARELLGPHLGSAGAEEVVRCCRGLDDLDRADRLLDLIAR